MSHPTYTDAAAYFAAIRNATAGVDLPPNTELLLEGKRVVVRQDGSIVIAYSPGPSVPCTVAEFMREMGELR